MNRLDVASPRRYHGSILYRCVSGMILLNIPSLKNTRFKIYYEEYFFLIFFYKFQFVHG